MKLAQSRVTAQGQVSVPAEVRRKLGLAAGSILEWDEEGGSVVVRRAQRTTSGEIHAALFPDGLPARATAMSVKDGIRARMRRRHAGR